MRAILVGSQLGSAHQLGVLFQELKLKFLDLKVGIDGGTHAWLQWGEQPDFIVGDWDSFSPAKQKGLKVPRLTLAKQKDRSDLFYGALAAIEAGANELLCLGVTGGRPDHHLASLLELSLLSTGKYGKLKAVEALGWEARYSFLSKAIPTWTRELPKNTLVSAFAMSDRVEGLSLNGFRYSVQNEVFLPSSRGLSNLTQKRKCEVCLRKGQLLVIMPRNGASK